MVGRLFRFLFRGGGFESKRFWKIRCQEYWRMNCERIMGNESRKKGAKENNSLLE